MIADLIDIPSKDEADEAPTVDEPVLLVVLLDADASKEVPSAEQPFCAHLMKFSTPLLSQLPRTQSRNGVATDSLQKQVPSTVSVKLQP